MKRLLQWCWVTRPVLLYLAVRLFNSSFLSHCLCCVSRMLTQPADQSCILTDWSEFWYSQTPFWSHTCILGSSFHFSFLLCFSPKKPLPGSCALSSLGLQTCCIAMYNALHLIFSCYTPFNNPSQISSLQNNLMHVIIVVIVNIC